MPITLNYDLTRPHFAPARQERKSALGKGALQKLSPDEMRKTRVDQIMGLFEQ